MQYKSNSEQGQLRLVSRLPGTWLSIADSELRTVATGHDQLIVDTRVGVYRVSSRIGDASVSRLVMVTPNRVTELDLTVSFSSAAPVPGTTTWNEEHASFITRMSREVATGKRLDARIILSIRNLPGFPQSPLTANGISLLNSNMRPVFTKMDSWVYGGDRSIAATTAPVAPGPYVLRMSSKMHGGQVQATDRTIWLSPGWVTIVFVPNRESGLDARGMSVQMVPIGATWPLSTDISQAVESALAGLRSGPPSITQSLGDLILKGDRTDPMLGILSARALLFDEHATISDPDLLDRLVARLLKLAGDHPDVKALAVRVKGQRRENLVTWPPMLAANYRDLLRTSDLDNMVLEPGSAAERVSFYMQTAGPWMHWRSTDQLFMPAARQITENALERVKKMMSDIEKLNGITDVVEQLGAEELAYRCNLPLGIFNDAVQQLATSGRAGNGRKHLSVSELIDAFGQMTLRELADLISAFEEKFDVKAPEQPAFMAARTGSSKMGDEFDVILQDAGERKAQVIKEVRALTSIGLKEAKDLVDHAPTSVLEKVSEGTADQAKTTLEARGATIEIK